jgi:methane/ammonia monooxygenase subunit C
VTLGWCGLFGAGGGVAAQIVCRMSNLADVIWNNAPKSILDPFPNQVAGAAKSGGY